MDARHRSTVDKQADLPGCGHCGGGGVVMSQDNELCSGIQARVRRQTIGDGWQTASRALYLGVWSWTAFCASFGFSPNHRRQYIRVERAYMWIPRTLLHTYPYQYNRGRNECPGFNVEMLYYPTTFYRYGTPLDVGRPRHQFWLVKRRP